MKRNFVIGVLVFFCLSLFVSAGVFEGSGKLVKNPKYSTVLSTKLEPCVMYKNWSYGGHKLVTSTKGFYYRKSDGTRFCMVPPRRHARKTVTPIVEPVIPLVVNDTIIINETPIIVSNVTNNDSMTVSTYRM